MGNDACWVHRWENLYLHLKDYFDGFTFFMRDIMEGCL